MSNKPSATMIAMLCKLIDEQIVIHLIRTIHTRAYYPVGTSGGSINMNTVYAAERLGYLVCDRNDNGRECFKITELGKQVAEENRNLYAPTERTLIMTKPVGRSFGSRYYDIGILCEVVRETERRVYVKILKDPNGWSHGIIEGAHTDSYVNVDNIARRGITEEQYEQVFELVKEHTEWNETLKAEEDEAIKAIRAPYEVRRKQKSAEMSARFNEIFGSS